MQKIKSLFEYNTTKKLLKLAEYGRNIQNMVDYVISIKSKEKRNKLSYTIINLMGKMNPHLKETYELKCKLWTHLLIIANYSLNIEIPYKISSNYEDTKIKKKLIQPYKSNNVKYKKYGKNIELIIEKGKNMVDQSKRRTFAYHVANWMKLIYITCNKEYISDKIVKNDLKIISNNVLVLDDIIVLNNIVIKEKSNLKSNRNKYHNRKH